LLPSHQRRSRRLVVVVVVVVVAETVAVEASTLGIAW